MDVELAQNFGKKLGAAWTFRGLDSWQQWRIPTFWHPQAMYTGIFNLCRMSATSGTKSCCLKSGNLSRQLFDANGFPKPKKNGVRHGHLEDYLLKWQQEINSLPATVNVQGNFPFVPDVGEIRHKNFWMVTLPCSTDMMVFGVCSRQVIFWSLHRYWLTILGPPTCIPISLLQQFGTIIIQGWIESAYWLQGRQEKKIIAEIVLE